MNNIPGLLLAGIFTLLSVVHFYWGILGISPGNSVIPGDPGGRLLFNPTRIQSLGVGVALALFTFFLLIKSDLWKVRLPIWLWDYGLWFIAALFAVRAFGDFRYIGFTKKIKGTAFAKMDTRFYSPLCILIAVLAIWLNLIPS